MKKFFSLILVFIIIFCTFSVSASSSIAFNYAPTIENNYLAVCDQKGGRILIFSQDSSFLEEEISWQWKPEGETVYNFSDVKLHYSQYFGQYVLAVCATNGYAAIVSYPTGKVLWYTERTPKQPEFIELLPNGNVCLSSSVGNCIRVYESNTLNSHCSSTDINLNGAAGLYFESETNTLFALSRSQLVCYLFKNNELTKIEDKVYSLPSFGGCEISPLADQNKLWITAGITVFLFDKIEGSFSTDYLGAKGINKKGTTTSICTSPSSKKIFTLIANNTSGFYSSSNVINVITLLENNKFEVVSKKSNCGAFSRMRILYESKLPYNSTFKDEHLSIEGIENNGEYKSKAHISIKGNFFERMTVNGIEVAPDSEGNIYLSASSKPYKIVVTDVVGFETEYNIKVKKDVNYILISIVSLSFLAIILIGLLLFRKKKN